MHSIYNSLHILNPDSYSIPRPLSSSLATTGPEKTEFFFYLFCSLEYPTHLVQYLALPSLGSLSAICFCLCDFSYLEPSPFSPLSSRSYIHWVIEKAREFLKNIYLCFIDYTKALTGWITTNCRKFFRRWEYQTTLPAS